MADISTRDQSGWDLQTLALTLDPNDHGAREALTRVVRYVMSLEGALDALNGWKAVDQ